MKLNPDTIGLWALRLLLVAGAIACEITGNPEFATVLSCVALWTFILLG